MEYIAGEPIDAWAANHALSVKGCLRLFQQVCSAVPYAHQRLIVHRDIKPGNILVTAEGVPRLLDFGIARFLSPDPERKSPGLTQIGVRMMTPEYAGPEQVRGEPATTATDVYSLGAALYRLLTGATLYDLANRTAAETERIVCEQNPRAPSQAAPAAVARQLRGDLDCIVLKALRKDPAQRYGSVRSNSSVWISSDTLQGLPFTLARKHLLT